MNKYLALIVLILAGTIYGSSGGLPLWISKLAQPEELNNVEKKPAPDVNSWTQNVLNFINDGGEFVIEQVNVCNDNGSCECEDLITITTVPGKGRGSDFSDRDLRGVDWSNQRLGNSRIHFSHLEGANLTNTNLGFGLLAESSLDDAIIVNANLVGANLQKASFRGANLQGTALFDGDLLSAYPVSFYRQWKSVTITTTPLADGTYIDQLNVEMCAGGKTYVTFLLLEGNGANVKDADFTNAKNLSKENIRYICRWGGEYTRKTLENRCNGIPPQTKNQFAAVITDTFLAQPELVSPQKGQVVDQVAPELTIAFSNMVLLRPDAIEIRAIGKQAKIQTQLVQIDETNKHFKFHPFSPLAPGISYEVVLLSGKALDHKGNLLREEIILGSFDIR